MEPKTTAITNSSAELRAGLERLRARYDGGAAAPAVFTVIKAIELEIAWIEHRREAQR